MPETLPMPITAPLSHAQRTQLLNLVRRAARAEILPRFRQLGAHEIDTKSGPQDLVTEADRAAERMITRGVSQMFPGALVIGEEACSEAPERMDRIAEAELAITIDPVDGTWNYARGLATFGVMVAILRFGTPVFGLLYDPVMNDVILADAERPAEMLMPRRAPRPVSTAPGGPAERLSGQIPLYLFERGLQDRVAGVFPLFERVGMLRCSCHEYRLLAQGHIDFVLAVRLTPWDHSPAAIITAQAGGHAAMLDGTPFNAANRAGYFLCAGSKQTWETVRDVLAFLIETPDPA